MIILTIRTEKADSEIGVYDGNKQLAYDSWKAHRLLAETIHTKIAALLKSIDKDWGDIEAILCFSGPGSFTGLRIGLAVANSLALGLSVPIVATNTDEWINIGINKLLSGQNDKISMPEYGAAVHITAPTK